MKQLLMSASSMMLSFISAYSLHAQNMEVKWARYTEDIPVNTSSSTPAFSTGIKSISASFTHNRVNLEWTTAGLPVTGYIVERSLDGEHFESIGSGSAAGYMPSSFKYSFTDKPGNKAIYQRDIFYRLGNRNEYNEIQYTKPILVRVNNRGNIDYITVMPNPQGNDISLVVALKEGGYLAAKISDDQGNEIMNKKGKVNSGQQQLTLTGTHKLEAGIYWLDLAVDSKPALKLRLIKD
ncbi:hypothetical protein [Flavihumibacter profundi]|jgi:hypothetical protein|uniref:hypothetical protein n=1 Tax=Flavihumibacter profundi TaxID=2716883 RepID=UPI001CC60EE0|nr:hypothetical protein [Flavihumibacter profundi]MBZ5858107.1 hypothetical protein [Flavihumibacter profundi]